MESYANKGGTSAAVAYETADDSITVRFRDGAGQVYTHASAGRGNVERMKELARAGQGLNTFINTVVKYRYLRRAD
jgi:hypothetical protein